MRARDVGKTDFQDQDATDVPTIQTYTGIEFDLADPQPDQIAAEDLAVHLARVPRFAGATSHAYSVAQHSVLVSLDCCGWPREALLHDAAEAYTGDITRPLKLLLGQRFSAIERRIMLVVKKKYKLSITNRTWAAVKRADDRLLATEARDLLKRPFSLPGVEPLEEVIIPWPEHVARDYFLGRFYELFVESALDRRKARKIAI